MGTFLTKLDVFAVPVSLTFKGKRGHSTAVGGFVSLISTICLITYSFWRVQYITNHDRDDYFLTQFFTKFEERKPYFLKDGDLDLRFAVVSNSKDFDIHDNPYGEFKLHRYSNIQNSS